MKLVNKERLLLLMFSFIGIISLFIFLRDMLV